MSSGFEALTELTLLHLLRLHATEALSKQTHFQTFTYEVLQQLWWKNSNLMHMKQKGLFRPRPFVSATSHLRLLPSQKPLRYRRAISYDSKEYYMRLLSGNPGMYQHSVEHNTEGETAQHEPEHGEDTIARVKGTSKAHRRLAGFRGGMPPEKEEKC